MVTTSSLISSLVKFAPASFRSNKVSKNTFKRFSICVTLENNNNKKNTI